MSIQKAIEENTIILTEAAVIEKLRRSEAISLHPRLENATLIYDVDGKRALREIYSGYIDIACKADLPINIATPTWRANRERVLEAVIGNINRDAVRFLSDLRNEWDEFSSRIFIGGLIGCKNDCYKTALGITTDKSYSVNKWKIEQLSK